MLFVLRIAVTDYSIWFFNLFLIDTVRNNLAGFSGFSKYLQHYFVSGFHVTSSFMGSRCSTLTPASWVHGVPRYLQLHGFMVFRVTSSFMGSRCSALTPVTSYSTTKRSSPRQRRTSVVLNTETIARTIRILLL